MLPALELHLRAPALGGCPVGVRQDPVLSGRSGGRHPTSSRGQLAKGVKTRTNNRTGRMISTKGEAAMVF